MARDRGDTFVNSNAVPERPVDARSDTLSDARSSEERYRTLFEQAPIGVFIFDRGSVDVGPRITECNRRFAEILRVDHDRLVGLALFSLRDARIRPSLERVLAGETTSYEGPYDATNSDAHLRVSIRLSPLCDEHGGVIGGMGLVEDITARFDAETALAATAQRLAVYVHRSPLAVIGFNVAFEIIEWNAAATSIFGWTESEAIGAYAPSLILPETNRVHIDSVWRELLQGQGGERSTNENVTKDGRTILCEWFNAPLVDREGVVIGVMSICADVTHRRLAEEALKRSEARFRAVIEAAPDAIGVHRDGRWLYVNPALVQYLGYDSPVELIGRSLRATVTPAAWKMFEGRPPELVGGKPTMQEYRLRRRDGATVLAEVVSIQVDYDGAPAIVAQARDVTERAQMQARLLQADRMVSVGTLAAGVAHEINNPLAYMMANLDVLATRRLPLLLERARLLEDASGEASLEVSERLVQATEMIEIVREGAARVREIVQDLRTFSRADDERRGPVDVRRVLDASINMAWNEIRHRARLVREYEEVPPIDANESRLGQVFLNLLINAAQALPVGEANAHTIRVRTEVDDIGRIAIAVSDTGPGIAPEIVGRIFDPFFTTKPVGVGTGLGLSICQGIVGALGGEIIVDSEIGRGTTFRVLLPTGRRATEPARNVSVLAADERLVVAPSKRGRVLIIDDEIALGDVMRDALSDEHDVTVARSGKHGLEILSAHDFDVVLCDLMMPEVSGIDVYERVHAESPERAARIVFVTGGAFTARSREFFAEITNARLDKPFELDTLCALIRARLV